MVRNERINRFVMMVVGDDYEDLAMIHDEVVRLATEEAVIPPPTRSEILAELTKLVDRGHVKAYILSTTEPTKEIQLPRSEGIVQVPESNDRRTGCYFLLTEDGLRFFRELPAS